MAKMYSFGETGMEKVMDENYNITRMEADKASFVQGGTVALSVGIEQEASIAPTNPSPTNGFEMN